MFIIEPVEEAKIGSDQSIRPAKTWGLPRAVEFGQNVRGRGIERKLLSICHKPAEFDFHSQGGWHCTICQLASRKNYVYTVLSCSMFFGGNNESDLIGESMPLIFLLLTAILVSVMSKGPNMRVQNILVKCVITFPPSLRGKPVRWRHYCLFDFFTDWFVFPASTGRLLSSP